MGMLSEIFSWWGGNTWGTRLTIARQGMLVGTDEFGNSYYEQRKGVGAIGPLGRPRRWVTYKDFADASKVTPDWHGWLHYTVDTPPTEQAYRPRPWQKPHRMNMTGTREAYRPSGSILASGKRPKATGDYKPWRPD
jgi:NADH:ubiquinone oxidoreductase subunit